MPIIQTTIVDAREITLVILLRHQFRIKVQKARASYLQQLEEASMPNDVDLDRAALLPSQNLVANIPDTLLKPAHYYSYFTKRKG